ncbi:GerMN domain-containing protein [bacterium]|jgi:hypothetical protein|nr:GerMN domain-containing protein [bacterium]MBT4121756.1 GerMN domain-containing protein [bacterium]MBT4334881.1 GerMN domain-containing protein [bacterium]MBT4495168.1 GerMN domain-containing protein [bacterium]MBT4763963.1 GerMN domain-containing protein [bacterium]
MKKYSLILLILVVPLIISGCFGFGDNSNNEEEKPEYIIYRNGTLGEADFMVKYNSEWKLEEIVSTRLASSTDEIVFKVGLNHKISLNIYNDIDADTFLESYTFEEITQTEVSRFIGKRIIGYIEDENNKEELIVVTNGSYIYVLKTNKPDSPEFVEFLNNVAIINNLNEIAEPNKKSVYRLYFINDDQESCQATYYREIYLIPEQEEFAFIPRVIMALLRPGELALDEVSLNTSIPLGTKLLSYGYDNNKVIVNLSHNLNEGGGSCMMESRRSQIEQTIMYLNELTELDIREVEIWVENSPENVLNP